MKYKLKQLLILATLSATMTACTPNPVNNNGGAGSYTGGNTNTGEHTNTGGSINTDSGTSTDNTNNSAYSGGNTSTNNNTGNTNRDYASTDNNTSNTKGEYTSTDNNNTSNTKGNYASTANNTGSSAHQGFVVQLIASSSQQKANTVKNTFLTEGYSVIQNNIKTNGRVLYRVQIGPYTTQGEARAVLAKMKTRYRRNAHVNTAIINENK
ncbi:MAG: SPOR domain-containing protein [Cocleimonas sp.]|nr:SPOR domain-containing protein [Cocleimonas sp.]